MRTGRLGFAALVMGIVVTMAQPADSVNGQENVSSGVSAYAFMAAGGFAGLLKQRWKAATVKKPPVQSGKLVVTGWG